MVRSYQQDEDIRHPKQLDYRPVEDEDLNDHETEH
jgi:hypothetical protein